MELATRPMDYPKKHSFHTTQWTVVLQAQAQNSQLALDQLCQRYCYPLYAFVRRQGHDAEEAKNPTQEFFAQFLEKTLAQIRGPGTRQVSQLSHDGDEALSLHFTLIGRELNWKIYGKQFSSTRSAKPKPTGKIKHLSSHGSLENSDSGIQKKSV